jgi:dihydrofolate reductase
MITVIAAMSKNGVIGKDNKLIWNLPSDMAYFKETTTGGTVVMGRKTFESIGRPLPNRRNIVVSRTGFTHDGVEVVSSIENALEICDKVCFVIGGGELYRQTLPIADKLLLTVVDCEVDGDTYFPDVSEGWIKISDKKVDADVKNEYSHTFIEYEKCRF